jgi:hypothetical protein
MRKAKDTELEDLTRTQRNEKTRLHDELATNIQDERRVHANNIELERESVKGAMDEVRTKYQRAHEAEQDKIHGAYGQFKDDVNERINTRERALSTRLHETEQQLVSEAAQQKLRYDLEKRNVIEAYTRSDDVLKNQRDRAIQEMADNKHQSLEKLRNEKDQFIGENNRSYRDRIDKMQVMSEQNMAQLDSYYKNQKEHNDVQQESRVRVVRTEAEKEKQNMKEFMDNNIEQTKEAKEDALRAERLRNIEDRSRLANQLSGELHKQEGGYSEKMQTLQESYEHQLAELKTHQKNELKRLKTQTEQRIEDQNKATDLAMQTQEIQHQRKIAQVNARHEEEIKDMNRKHQAQVESLVNHLKQNA